jgi:hypothetical protein
VLVRLLILLISLPLHATVFQKQPVTTQIKEADGIVIGHYLRKKYIKLDDGKVATQMIFKMNKEAGMQSELFGMDEIIIHYPGGRTDEGIVRVDGVPEFMPGENVVLMVKSFEDRYWGMNLAFGTFRVINYGKEKLIVNSVFPEDRNVGQMKLEDFEREVKRIKGAGLKVVLSPDYPGELLNDGLSRAPASVETGKNRALASDSVERENNDGTGPSTMWLIFVLAAMGGIFRLLRQEKS